MICSKTVRPSCQGVRPPSFQKDLAEAEGASVITCTTRTFLTLNKSATRYCSPIISLIACFCKVWCVSSLKDTCPFLTVAERPNQHGYWRFRGHNANRACLCGFPQSAGTEIRSVRGLSAASRSRVRMRRFRQPRLPGVECRGVDPPFRSKKFSTG